MLSSGCSTGSGGTYVPEGWPQGSGGNSKKIFAPEYPEKLRDNKTSGDVLLQVIFDSSGKVIEVIVLKSNRDAFSDSSAKAAKGWKFTRPFVRGMPTQKGDRYFSVHFDGATGKVTVIPDL